MARRDPWHGGIQGTAGSKAKHPSLKAFSPTQSVAPSRFALPGGGKPRVPKQSFANT